MEANERGRTEQREGDQTDLACSLYSTAQSPFHPSGLWTVDFSSAARTQLRRLKKQFAPLDGGPAAAVPLSLATAGSALQSVGKTMLNLLHKHATKSDRCFPFSVYFFLFSLSASGSGTRWDRHRQRGVDSEYEGEERNFLRPSDRRRSRRGAILHASSPPQCNNSSPETFAEGVARQRRWRRQLLDFLITPLSARRLQGQADVFDYRFK